MPLPVKGYIIRRSRKGWQLTRKPWYIFCILVVGIAVYILTIGLFAFVLHARMERSNKNLFFSLAARRDDVTFLLTPAPYHTWIDEEGCSWSKNASHMLVTFIKSRAINSKRRELMRRTWNGVCHMNGWNFKAVYLIGRTDSEHVTNLLLEEQARYSDLLQYDGPDDYVNMPLKVLAGMEWASRNLPPNVHYGSADDDFLVDVGRFTAYYASVTANTSAERQIFIRNQTADPRRVKAERWRPCAPGTPGCMERPLTNRTDLDPVPIMCLFRRGDREQVNRKKGSKWFVSRKVYALDEYPRYCHGGMYLMPLLLSNILLHASHTAPILRLDDVWLTGILRERAGIPDYMVADLEPLALHYGPRERRQDLYKVMEHDWAPMLANMTRDHPHTCKCRL